MANIKSQKKRNRQNETRRMRNKAIMSDLKTSIKKVEAAAAAGESTDELFQARRATSKEIKNLEEKTKTIIDWLDSRLPEESTS